MKLVRLKVCWIMLLLGLAAPLIFSGCASTNSENASVRPWNAPVGWENGLPSSMMEGR